MQAKPANQVAGSEPRGKTLEECLKLLEPLSIARGQLVVTDGTCDLRVSVERGQIDLELLGYDLPKGLQGEAAIVRAILDTTFWDQPVQDVHAGPPLALADDPKKPRPRIHVARPEAPRDVCRGVADELARIEAVRRRVPTLSCTAQATPTSREAKGGSPVAAKLRAALVARNGAELLLADWAREQGLSATDVATGLAELLDANEAKVARKQDPVASAQRAETALKGGGFCPGLRLERGARGIQAKDAARAAAAWVRAGHERLAAGRISEALDAFNHGLGANPGALADGGIGAMEGLLIALELDAKDQRRPAGVEARSPGEMKRVALDLGRTYFALGLMNRARGALERALDDSAPVPYQLELIDALAGAGQLGKALDRAEALAPRLDRGSRRALAQKLAENAKGPSLERALGLAGVRGEKRTATLALGVAAVALVLALGFGVQASAASSLVAASKDARERLAKDGPTPELANEFQSIADRYRVVPAARRAAETAAQLSDLAADVKWLRENAATLDWRASSEPEEARKRIAKAFDGARTEALRVRIKASMDALDRAEKDCRAQVDVVKNSTVKTDYVEALENARKLVAEFPQWKALWKDVRVPLRLRIERPEDAIVEWDGERIPNTPPMIVFLPLVPGSSMLNARGEPGSGWKSDLRKVELQTATSTITILLERDPAAPKLPDPKPRPGTDTTPTTGGTSTTTTQPGGTRTDPKGSGKGKISIGGATGPDPGTPERPDDGDKPQAQKAGKFVVREVAGADLQKLLGGPPTDVLPSTGYFDFLASELPRDGRLSLSIDVLTRVRDKKVYLAAVRLRLEDTVLGHGIPTKDIELEDVQRPTRLEANGRRSVLALDQLVGEDFEQAKFKSQLRDGLVGMIRDFNKREGQ